MTEREFLLDLLDREREAGRMAEAVSNIHEIIDWAISEALDDDMKALERPDAYHVFRFDCPHKITIPIGELIRVSSYVMPQWLLDKASAVAEKVKEAQ